MGKRSAIADATEVVVTNRPAVPAWLANLREVCLRRLGKGGRQVVVRFDGEAEFFISGAVWIRTAGMRRMAGVFAPKTVLEIRRGGRRFLNHYCCDRCLTMTGHMVGMRLCDGPPYQELVLCCPCGREWTVGHNTRVREGSGATDGPEVVNDDTNRGGE